MRIKLVVLLVSAHYYRVKTYELLSEWKMKCAWNTMNILYLLYFLVLHTCYFNFINLFIFPIKKLMRFPNYEINITPFVNNMWAREKTLWCPSLTYFVRSFSVEIWERRVLWGKRWMERLFISRQSRQSYFDLLVM